jgi:hypothetical protein
MASGCVDEGFASPSIMSASNALSANSSISSSISGGSPTLVGKSLDMLSSDIWTPLRFPKPGYQRFRDLTESASNPDPQAHAKLRQRQKKE